MSEPARRVVVAIDGPSGAGKSTIGRALAEALSYTYLDTGAMYRAVALRALEKGLAADDETALQRAASSARITVLANGKRVLLDGRDVTEEIRTPEATRMASAIAKVSAVRRELVRQQQELGRPGGVVLDGRDIGSVVFPRAEVKFYLDAAPEKRAQRRLAEGQSPDASLEAVLEEIRARDHQDMTRATSPLVRTADAVYVDTTEMSPEEVIARLLAVTQGRIRVISQP
jgi:cytidylate kinase